MLSFVRENRRLFLVAGVAALLLRLLFVIHFPAVTDDSRIYSDFASNWMQHGIYGQTRGVQVVPVDTRLPGYPAFLVAMYWLFGVGNFRAVMLAQVAFDLATCVVIADVARRAVSGRAGRVALVLAALCPFLANYTAAVLTESLEIFFTAAALDCAIAASNPVREGRGGGEGLWAGSGLAMGTCILLRPDGGILLAAVLLYLGAAAGQGRSGGNALRRWRAAGIVMVFALGPLVPWMVRNALVLHQFQPLAPRYANDADELALRGFNRWVKTWMVDYVSVEEIYWNVPGDKIDAQKLPRRAVDEEDAAQRDGSLALIDEYNETQDMTADLDARFGRLAGERMRSHPVRDYALLPGLRVADMWLRPRTELLPVDPRWWEFNDDVGPSMAAVGLGLMNLAYCGAALWVLVFRRRNLRACGLLVAFVLLRSAFLGTLENPEPRYTLECYPAVIVLASALAGRKAPALGKTPAL